MIIYKATNKINNKFYIGKTVRTLNKRIKSHLRNVKNGSNTYFHNALRKYGIDNFDWELLYECNDNMELGKKEIEFIKLYDANNLNKGYNLTSGGDGGDTWTLNTHKEETSKKLSYSIKNSIPHKEAVHSDDFRKKISDRNKNWSDEVKQKISKRLKGKSKSKEHKKKLSDAHKGKILTEEHKKNISKAVIKRMENPEEREKISKTMKGKPSHRKGKKMSMETREKMRLAHLGKKHSNETIKKISESNKKTKRDKEKML
jgi:group I intron endonuclease